MKSDVQRWLFRAVLVTLLFASCAEKEKTASSFNVLKSNVTGINFSNDVHSTDSFNLFRYMYFYNGAGVAAGDFNNDGFIDLFFASNQAKNALYLNKGNLRFEDVTDAAQVPADTAWNTGVSVVDINNDGLLDLYICRVGQYMTLNSRNQFLLCEGIDKDGVPKYADKAKELGVDFSGFGTQAAFLDYDLDGDLDLFLLNHSIHHTGNFRERKTFDGTYHATSGSRFYRNDGNVFTEVTKETGINSSAIGYGLGVAVSDINLDGYPDIYVGNDFHENDYLYINQKNGSFADMSGSSLMHTSRYTMGVDIADVNNDAFPEIISVDMMPPDPEMQKRSPGEDNIDILNLKISYGYNYQYSRNALQLNRRNGWFSEVGLYSNVFATDWSWAPLWMDFDNDGLKDLFISNGIPKRLNDIDYINYISDRSIQEDIVANRINETDKKLIDKFPRIKIANRFFQNAGGMRFEDIGATVNETLPTFSNGAVYADFDNDGDLDIVVNNIDDKALLYQNTTNDANGRRADQLILKGSSKNINAVGAKVIVFAGNDLRMHEKYPVHGFLSSMEIPVHIGLGDRSADSVLLVWPDNTYQRITLNGGNRDTLTFTAGLPEFDYSILSREPEEMSPVFTNIAPETGLDFVHRENLFNEFNREPLLPQMVSTEGPALAIADINGDGHDDVFAGAAKGFPAAVYISQNGRLERVAQPALAADSIYEDVNAVWADVNKDGSQDLLVLSGGNEYYGHDAHLLPRLYINDGTGRLQRKKDAFTGLYQTFSVIAVSDFTGDGNPDLFVGGRAVPWQYGAPTQSFLLKNDGSGRFTDVTAEYSKDISQAGFVTDAIWTDVNGDKRPDLVVCSQWGTVDAYIREGENFQKHVICPKKGWWNTVAAVDINGDGRTDIVAGNFGLNSRLKPTPTEPVRLYYNDFDDNGQKEQIVTYYLHNKEIPLSSKADMEKQIPHLKKQFLYAKDFAAATLSDILSSDKLDRSHPLLADYFSHCLLVNNGNTTFTMSELPWESQLSTVRDIIVDDVNGDGTEDLVAVGNFYANNPELGRNDASFGSLLFNDGSGNLRHETIKGVVVTGEARQIQKMRIGGKTALVIARNNDSIMVISKQARK